MIETFGILESGETVDKITIGAGRITASIITRGASVQDLRVAGIEHPLVLGFPSLDGYLANPSCFGATVGRFANRISNGQVCIDSKSFQLDRNEGGRQTLHGGWDGSQVRNWRIADHGVGHVSLVDRLSDGHMGFPGTLDIRLTYSVLPPMTLMLEFRAVTTAATPCSFAHHSYFNLDGTRSVLDHQLRIDADHYLELDEHKIPTGEIVPVDGTELDFRTLRPISDVDAPFFHDHNFCLADGQRPLRPVALLRGADAGIEMEVATTEPGVQLCHGAMTETRDPGLSGIPYACHGGIALEPQRWPDSPNQPGFPPSILRPDGTYRQTTRFCFREFG